MQNRREMWRQFMGCFEPAADPRDAIARGFYVAQPGRTIGEELAARFDLKPAASHLLVGGVGSGKTTQLLVTRDALKATSDVCALYVDVSLFFDPTSIWGSDVLATVGSTISAELDASSVSTVENQIALFDKLLRSDEPGPFGRTDVLQAALRDVQSALSKKIAHIVVLIDALDRMTNLDRFGEIAVKAVPILRSLGIGVILVGPLAAIYGLHGTITDRFDRFHHIPTVDVQNDAEGRAFLVQVLRARDRSGLISDSAAGLLASRSGGVLRDLIALTQLAAEEAYVDAADHVESRHVDVACDIFGRKQMAALDSEQIKRLLRVRRSGTFVQTSERDLALLSTRRILEYPHGQPRFAVHPTMEPLLAQFTEAG